jgi:uncharacterized damage-inducible protein DinB
MTGRGQLLAELEWICRNTGRLLDMVRPEHMDWRPQGNMRTFGELGDHLSQIPMVDFLIMRGTSQEEVNREEEKLMAAARSAGLPRGWSSVLADGCKELYRFMEKMPQAEYENASGTAYFGRTQTYARWLLEVITHMYHHRAQLFMYLKLNGYPVNTRTLYD